MRTKSDSMAPSPPPSSWANARHSHPERVRAARARTIVRFMSRGGGKGGEVAFELDLRRLLRQKVRYRRWLTAEPHLVSPRETLGRGKGVTKPRAIGIVLEVAGRQGRGLRARCDTRGRFTMTTGKKLKKAVRARAQKTGESYAAARRHVVLVRGGARRSPEPAAASAARVAPVAAVAKAQKSKGSITDASCRAKTGHGFEHWFRVRRRVRRGRARSYRLRASPVRRARRTGLVHAGHHRPVRARARPARDEPGVRRQVPGLGVAGPAGVARRGGACGQRPRLRAAWVDGDAEIGKALAVGLAAKGKRLVRKGDDAARLRFRL